MGSWSPLSLTRRKTPWPFIGRVPTSLRPATLVAQTIAPGDRKPPVPFCVAIKLSRDADGGVSGATRGLAAFDLMEIEAAGFAGDPRQLNGLMLDLAGHLIEAGPVIKDGDTIGPDAATKIVVRHETSGFMPGRPVYRLYFQGKGGESPRRLNIMNSMRGTMCGRLFTQSRLELAESPCLTFY
jgi:hypothetical protein